MISPMIFRQKGNNLWITDTALQQLISDPRPILWCNAGLYGMIPIEVVRNELSAVLDQQRCYRHKPGIGFHWGEVTELPSEVGRKLERGFQNPVKGLPISVFPIKDER